MSIGASEAGQLLAASISACWIDMADIHLAEDLSAAITQQREACNQALALKDSILAALREALTGKEAHFIQGLGVYASVRCCSPSMHVFSKLQT